MRDTLDGVKGLARFLPVFLAVSTGFAQAPRLAEILRSELDRNFQALQQKADPKPYFLSYEVTDLESRGISARDGSATVVPESRHRYLDISVRVGSRDLDNYHVLDGSSGRFTRGLSIPVEDVADAVRRPVWLETNRVYQLAARRLMDLKTRVQMKTEDGPKLSEFSMEKPATAVVSVPPLELATEPWEKTLTRVSQVFAVDPRILNSVVSLSAVRDVRTLVSSEGTDLQDGRCYYRIVMSAAGKSPDGTEQSLSDTFEGASSDELPTEKVLTASAKALAEKLEQLMDAPETEPYVGPAILSGRAAGVFFHEIFGHRVEGHRLRDESDGQTFAKSLNSAVLPDFLSVDFDPTRKTMAGTDLNGWYDYDDQGVKARPVELVKDGILKTFLLSRTPVDGFSQSNGHGRRQPGYEVVARQSNLIVESAKQVSPEALRKMLLDQVRKQGKPYGLYFEQVVGGYTTTERRGFQAFKVLPVLVYRVYPDGRPDELVRGVDIVGTPLASFRKILATDDRPEVFNGYCGAESGSVPVSAVSPALLLSEIEIQKKPGSRGRIPILSPPETSVGSGR